MCKLRLETRRDRDSGWFQELQGPNLLNVRDSEPVAWIFQTEMLCGLVWKSRTNMQLTCKLLATLTFDKFYYYLKLTSVLVTFMQLNLFKTTYCTSTECGTLFYD